MLWQKKDLDLSLMYQRKHSDLSESEFYSVFLESTAMNYRQFNKHC